MYFWREVYRETKRNVEIRWMEQNTPRTVQIHQNIKEKILIIVLLGRSFVMHLVENLHVKYKRHTSLLL